MGQFFVVWGLEAFDAVDQLINHSALWFDANELIVRLASLIGLAPMVRAERIGGNQFDGQGMKFVFKFAGEDLFIGHLNSPL